MCKYLFTHLEDFGVLLLQCGSVEEFVGDGCVGEVVADLTDAFVAPASETKARDWLALEERGRETKERRNLNSGRN